MKPRYYYYLDILRGFAALAILFWHYQHFTDVSRSFFPLYDIFWPFYEYGDMAVQLFWLLSGFVFINVYLNSRDSSLNFFLARFARLYPLHFLTLIVVALLQVLHLKFFGDFRIYEFNDPYHFLLNILFVPYWGFQEGRSFNAPVWSVSVEILIYVIFWLLLPLISVYKKVATSLVALLMFFLYESALPGEIFWECGVFFFVGVLVYFCINSFSAIVMGMLSSTLLLSSVFLFSQDLIGYLLFQLGMFASLIALVASLDLMSPEKKSSPRIGDLSYGVYLLHVPIQLILLFVVDLKDLDSEIVFNPLFLLLFFVLTITVSNVLFVYFEKPALYFIKHKGKTFLEKYGL